MDMMGDSDPLNGLNSRINDRGYFERIMHERERVDEERDKRLEERFDAMDKALSIQATEYARRLHDLNGEYKRDKERQSDYVTIEKYESQSEAERVARIAALLRVDEKFEEYVKRYEQRQREVDLLLAAQKGAAEQAVRALEEAGRKSNRNLGVASLGLALLVLIANLIPLVVH